MIITLYSNICHQGTIMKLSYFLVLWSLCYSSWAQAEIYKRVDADGHVTYSSTPLKGGKKLHLAPLPTVPRVWLPKITRPVSPKLIAPPKKAATIRANRFCKTSWLRGKGLG